MACTRGITKMFCKEKCDDPSRRRSPYNYKQSAYTAKKQSTGYAADKSRQHRHNYLKRLYKHKHKRRKQPKPTYVSLKCITDRKLPLSPAWSINRHKRMLRAIAL